MAKIIDAKFEGGRVILDGNEYVNCNFTNCMLIFTGFHGLGLSGCTFTNCVWGLEGPAGQTVEFLRAIYHGAGPEGQGLVEDVFNEIRKPRNVVEAQADGISNDG